MKVGRLGRPVGLDGFIGIYVEDADLAHLEPGSPITIGTAIHVVRALRRGRRGHELAFEDIQDREGAEQIRGSDVYVDARRELGEAEFWPSDLVGLEVRPGGGRVVDVVHGPTQDRLVVERDGARFEVPFVDELVPLVDLGGGFVEIREIEGLNAP